MVQALTLALLLGALLASDAYAQAQPTCTVTANPANATGSADVTVTWTATDATNCTASGGWAGPKDCAGGSQVMQDVTQSRTFNLTARSATGKAVAKYTKPTQNTDGTPATVTGFKLYVASAPSQLPAATPIALPASPLEYTIWREPGDVSVGVKAVRQDGVESAMSNVASKKIQAAFATCKATVTINAGVKAPVLTLTWLKELFGIKSTPTNGET